VGTCEKPSSSLAPIVSSCFLKCMGPIRVIFYQDGSFIENIWTNDKIWLREDNGAYVLDMVAAPPEKKVESGFAWQGVQR